MYRRSAAGISMTGSWLGMSNCDSASASATRQPWMTYVPRSVA
jgi:hypothetical protein